MSHRRATLPVPCLRVAAAAGRKRDLVLALLLTLGAAAFRLPSLGFPEDEYFDEVYHAKSAREYLAGEQPGGMGAPAHREAPHRPGRLGLRLRELGLAARPRPRGHAAGARLLLPGPARARRPSAPPSWPPCLLLADGVYLVQSRIAMTNIFAVLFQCAAALVRAAGRPRRSGFPPPAWSVLGLCPRPRGEHALDEPVGGRLPGPRSPGPAPRPPLPPARAAPHLPGLCA